MRILTWLRSLLAAPSTINTPFCRQPLNTNCRNSQNSGTVYVCAYVCAYIYMYMYIYRYIISCSRIPIQRHFQNRQNRSMYNRIDRKHRFLSEPVLKILCTETYSPASWLLAILKTTSTVWHDTHTYICTQCVCVYHTYIHTHSVCIHITHAHGILNYVPGAWDENLTFSNSQAPVRIYIIYIIHILCIYT